MGVVLQFTKQLSHPSSHWLSAATLSCMFHGLGFIKIGKGSGRWDNLPKVTQLWPRPFSLITESLSSAHDSNRRSGSLLRRGLALLLLTHCVSEFLPHARESGRSEGWATQVTLSLRKLPCPEGERVKVVKRAARDDTREMVRRLWDKGLLQRPRMR